jgi:hypothetical protein
MKVDRRFSLLALIITANTQQPTIHNVHDTIVSPPHATTKLKAESLLSSVF